MKYTWLMVSVLLAGCAGSPSAPPPSKAGMANPASVYCLQKGGEQIPAQRPQGAYTLCKLPGGEVIDEWDLWRRDHPSH